MNSRVRRHKSGPMLLLVDYSQTRAGVDIAVPPQRCSAPLFGLAPRRVPPRRRASHHDCQRRSMFSILEPEEGHAEDEDPEIRINFRMRRRGSTGGKMLEIDMEASSAKLQKSLTQLFLDDNDDDDEGENLDQKFDEDKDKGDKRNIQGDDHSRTSSTFPMEDFSSSFNMSAKEDHGHYFVDTRNFIRGELQIIVSRVIAGEDTAHVQPAGKAVSASASSVDLPEDTLPVRSTPNSSFRQSQIKSDASEPTSVPEHTRRVATRLSSLQRSKTMHDSWSGISQSNNQLVRSASLKCLKIDNADCRRITLKKSSSTKTKLSESEIDSRHDDSLRLKVHAKDNAIEDISDFFNDVSSMNVSNGTSRRRIPTRNFSMMNFAGDIKGAIQLDRRAGLKKNKTVSSMRNLTRTLMDDTSSRNHYYRGCSMRNLMSDSRRTFSTLMKSVSERNLRDVAKRTHNDSVARFNLMRQNSGRNVSEHGSNRNLTKKCSERSLNVDQMNMMRQNSGRNHYLKDHSTSGLMLDLTQKTMGQDSSRRTCTRNLALHDSNKSMSMDQSMSTTNTRRQNRRLATRSRSMRNLIDISETNLSMCRSNSSNALPRTVDEGEKNEAQKTSRSVTEKLESYSNDLLSLKSPSSKEKRDPRDNERSAAEASRRMGLLIGRTISFRSNSKRNLCRVNSGRSHSGSPVPKHIATSPRS